MKHLLQKTLLVLLCLAACALAAVPSTAVWESQPGTGSDTANAGGFDSGNASMATDLAATGGNTASPVATSASYTFVAGDVGAKLFVKSGTSWNPGWYPIISVSAGAATLNGSTGQVLFFATSPGPPVLATTTGCASVASPTSGTWSIDRSQLAASLFGASDLAVDSVTNTKVTASGHTFTKSDVGNSIIVTAGAGFTTGRYFIQSVASGAATLDRSPAATSTSGGTWALGGCTATPGIVGSVAVAGNKWWLKGTYTPTSSSSNVSGGIVNVAGNNSAIFGYGTVRGDSSRATISAGSLTTVTLLTLSGGDNMYARNLIVDCNSGTSNAGISATGFDGIIDTCKAMNFKNGGITAATRWVVFNCEATGGTAGTPITAQYFDHCYVHGCTASQAFGGTGTGAAAVSCVSYLNTGKGFNTINYYISCLSHSNTDRGFDGLQNTGFARDSISYNNSAGGSWNSNGPLYNCAGTDFLSGAAKINCVTLTMDPCTNAAAGDFSLNNNGDGVTTFGGKQLKAAGFNFAAGTATTTAPDVGPMQHPDSPKQKSYAN